MAAESGDFWVNNLSIIMSPLFRRFFNNVLCKPSLPKALRFLQFCMDFRTSLICTTVMSYLPLGCALLYSANALPKVVFSFDQFGVGHMVNYKLIIYCTGNVDVQLAILCDLFGYDSMSLLSFVLNKSS